MGRKAKAASSAKALELCGDTSRLGVSAADVFAQFAKPVNSAEDAQCAALEDAEVSMALQGLQKKDPTTRLRNVGELRELLAARSPHLGEICVPFLHIYRRLWPQDSEPRVREGLQRCLQVLVESMQRDFAKHLRTAFPTWLCAMFDTHAEVAQAARSAFLVTFSTDEKRRGVFRHSQKECLALLSSNLRHSEQSLHDELGIVQSPDKDTALERQDRYARVVAASLSALGELVHVCSAPHTDASGAPKAMSSSQLQPFFEAGSACAVWPRLASKQPIPVRRAAVQCLVRILRCDSELGLGCATVSTRSAALNAMADDALPPSSAIALVQHFAAAGAPDCWEGLVASKSLWPQLQQMLRCTGGAADAADFLTRFQELVRVFPRSAWTEGKAEALLQDILEALSNARGGFSRSPDAAWRAYFAICSAAPVVDEAWRWHPVLLYLDTRTEGEASPPQVTLPRPVLAALPAALAGELPRLPEAEKLLDILGSALEAKPDAGEPGYAPAWRASVSLIQQLLKVEGSLEGLRGLLQGQLRQLFLEALKLPGAHGFAEVLDALSVLLLCDGLCLSPEDEEVRDALVGATGAAGLEHLPEWPEQARVLAWPFLPWWASLTSIDTAAAAEAVGQRLVKPLLTSLARRLDTGQEQIRELLLEVMLAQPGLQALQLRLTLECIPESYSPGSSVRLQEAVSLLVGRIITDPSSVSNLEEALAALSLAFDVIDCQLSCAKELVHAAEGDLRLMLLATKALRADRSLLQPLCRSLLAALSHAEDVADEAWAALSQLLRRLGPAAAAELLAETDAKANNWLRLLLEGSSSTELSPLLLLSRAKGPLRGAVQAAQLRHMAQHSAKLLEGASLETEASELLEVFWEVLLAVTVGAAKDEASLSAAARVWGFLRTSSKATRLSFLEVCAKQAAAEGQAGAWWLEESEPDAPIATASLGGLLLLRHVLPALWPDRQAAEELGAEVLLKWALEADDSSSSKGWGHAAAEVVRRAVQLGAAPGSWVSAARSELRGRLRVACAEKTVTEQLLALAGAVEAAPMRAKEAAKVAVSDGPLITAASEGDVAMAEPNEEELDMGLVDTIEKLLRWSQASSETSRADALAAFAAACWPSVSSPGVGGTLPSRMTRLALEMLGAAPGPAALAAPKKPLPAMPGTWRLVAALCRHGQWPESSWPGVLQSLVEANHWLASAQLSAFVEDAFCAAAELLPLGPVPLDHLASLLHCSDAGLRSAAARQLQRRSWVPQAEAEATPSPAQEALEKLAGLLEAESEEKEPSEGESGAGAASAGDVSFCVLKAVLGQEMTHTVWSAGEALSTLASWEEGDEPGGRGYGSRMREGHYCALAPEDAGSTPSCSSRGRNLVWMSQGDHERLPPECERQCVAAIASWETLLSGIDRGLQGDRGGKGEKEEASPASLLATLVQLSPDQLAHGTGKSDFPANVAPPSHWATPLQPLLRLLCHILTSSRLAGFTRDDTDASEALLAEALKEPVASYDLIPLAARTLLLALRLAPAAVRSFWEQLPRSRDQNLVEKLIARSFTPLLIQAEAALAISQLEAERDRLPDIETSVVRRPRQLLLQLSREDLRAELSVQLPPSFPLRPARAEFPEKMPGIPKPRVRNWILQAQKVLSGQRPLVVGRAVLMWSRSFALYFKGVEDCPICYNVIQLTTQTIPRKACPTCKHKFHDKCLYQWFRTSSKTTCPLCNQPF